MQVCQHPPRSVAEKVAGSLAGRPQNRDPLVFTVYARYLPVSVPVRDGSARGPPGDGPGCRQSAADTDPVRAHRQRPEWNRGWDDPFVWRRLRGSNPRGSCPPTRFPGVCLRPLGQASAAQSSQPRHAPATNRGEVVFDGGYRRSAVNSSAVIPIRRRMPASVPVASSRWSGTAHGHIGARPRFTMPQDLVIAFGADGYEAGALQCADGLLS
jgi:hypothetical protein